jgi:bifunctional ADP-heptose synthase (sugar kinase/adenylyltransferase)
MRPGVDTRSKILTGSNAGRLSGPLTVVTGYFDVVLAGHARDLEAVRERSPDRPVLVVLLAHPGEVLEAPVRAELVAALRVVDYVVITDHDHLDELIQRLRPAELVRLESADLGRTRRLIEDAQRSQTR